MKDPAQQITDALITLIGSLSYLSEPFRVVANMPDVKMYNYIWIQNVLVRDDITGDYFHSECSVDIEISAGGWRQEGNRQAVNSVSNSLMQAITKKTMSMTDFTVGVLPHLVSATNQEIREGNEIINKKFLTYALTVKQN